MIVSQRLLKFIMDAWCFSKWAMTFFNLLSVIFSSLSNCSVRHVRFKKILDLKGEEIKAAWRFFLVLKQQPLTNLLTWFKSFDTSQSYLKFVVAVVLLVLLFFFFLSIRSLMENNSRKEQPINLARLFWKCVSEMGSITLESAGTLWSNAAWTNPALRHSSTSKPPEGFLDTGWIGAEGGVCGGNRCSPWVG